MFSTACLHIRKQVFFFNNSFVAVVNPVACRLVNREAVLEHILMQTKHCFMAIL